MHNFLEYALVHSKALIGTVAIFVVFYLFGPFRYLILRRQLRIEGVSENPHTSTIVMLIHGTYARNARWTRSSGLFASRLKDRLPDSSIYRLLWSGDNSHSQRVRAAIAIKQWIKTQPHGTVYLIGHSHGGLIAALAATYANDKRVKVITLSTPFINITPRYASFVPRFGPRENKDNEKRLVLGLIINSIVLSLLFFPTTGLALILIAMAVSFTVFFWFTFSENSYMKFAIKFDEFIDLISSSIERRSEEIYRTSKIRLRREQLHIVRAAGDEATGFLIIGQMVTWLTYALCRPLGILILKTLQIEAACTNILDRTTVKITKKIRPFFIFFGLTMIAILILQISNPQVLQIFIILAFAIPLVAISFLTLHPITTLTEPPIILTSWAIAFLACLPFSVELAVSSIIISVTVESAPMGEWRLITLPNDGAFLAHSRLYDSDLVIDLIHEIHKSRDH